MSEELDVLIDRAADVLDRVLAYGDMRQGAVPERVLPAAQRVARAGVAYKSNPSEAVEMELRDSLAAFFEVS